MSLKYLNILTQEKKKLKMLYNDYIINTKKWTLS